MEYWQIQELMITSAAIVAVLVPVLALTYRFVLRPAWKDKRALPKPSNPDGEALRDARLDNMERQLESLENSVERLVEVTEFDRLLMSGPAQDGPGSPGGES